MKRVLPILFCSFFISLVQGQNFSGVVTDKEDNPLEFVNVALCSLSDSALITGTVTDEKGEFSLNPNGNGGKGMFLQLSFVGYKTQTVEAKPQQSIVLENAERRESFI